MAKNNPTNLYNQMKNMGINVDAFSDDLEGGEELTPVDVVNASLEESLKNFNEILDSLSTTEERKRVLWKQIFGFALEDRKNAYYLFSDLYDKVIGNSAEHSVHGQNLSKYLERMSKANDQLIKLAEIIDEQIKMDEDELLSEENIYEQFQNKQTLDSTKK